MPKTPSKFEIGSKSIFSCSSDTRDHEWDFTFEETFPAVYVPYAAGSSKVIIYFHGNAEDLGYSQDDLIHMSKYCKSHVIAPEYPGYGIDYASKVDAFEIKKRGLSLYKYLIHFGFEQQDIIIYGRSIGTGTASYVASETEPAMLLLHSPFSSISSVALKVTAFYHIPKLFIKERFDTLSLIRKMKCPIVITHGINDDVIPIDETERLERELQRREKNYVCRKFEFRGHNDMDLEEEVLDPLKQFLWDCDITLKPYHDDLKLTYFELGKFLEKDSGVKENKNIFEKNGMGPTCMPDREESKMN